MEKKFNPVGIVFTEKHRPYHVKDLVGNEIKEKILAHLQNPMSVPNFLFHSLAAGSGKTSAALAIIHDLGCDALILNSSDDRKIETVREKIKNFCMTKSSQEGKKRAIFLDEADSFTLDASNALRNIMETYAGNSFFILTANRLNKISEPIRSRCIEIPFAHPNKDEIYPYLENICVLEKMDYTEEAIKLLIDLNYPSIRNMVLALQDLYALGKPVVKENIRPKDELFAELWVKLQNKDLEFLRIKTMQGEIDCRELNGYFWKKFVEESNLKGIQLTASNEKAFAMGASEPIIFVTSLFEMVK